MTFFDEKKNSFVIFSEILSLKTLVRIRIRSGLINSLDLVSDSAKCLDPDPDPDPDSVNPDPQPWFLRSLGVMQIHHLHFFFSHGPVHFFVHFSPLGFTAG